MQRMATHSMVFAGYSGDDCASEGAERAARGMVQGLKSMDDTRERIVAQPQFLASSLNFGRL